MTIEKKLLGTNPVSGEVLPEAVSFDGTNDYLTRSSDLTGNADGKTFTLSFWVYHSPNAVHGIYRGIHNAQNTMDIRFSVSDIIIENKYAGSVNLQMYSSGALVPKDTFVNIIISIDMADTSKRFVYMNDVDVTSRFTFSIYNNGLLSFTQPSHYIASRATASYLHGRLAHLFLDHTYRDLSVTANRRLFIDADGKPSDTIPSSPIIYLPMTDAATAGSNSGTGGDFTVNGVLATAERGPNQDNCSASTFDGSADYLSRSSISGLSNGKLFTFSVNASQTTPVICQTQVNAICLSMVLT